MLSLFFCVTTATAVRLHIITQTSALEGGLLGG